MAESLPRGILKDRFAEWYRSVTVDLSEELVEARRGAIEAMAASLDIKSALSVVAYAHGRKQYGPHLIEWIRHKGTEHDEGFSTKPGDLEPRVMTACAVAHRIVTTPSQPTATVLSLLCLNAAYCRWRPAARGQDLVGLATLHLEVMSDRAKGRVEASATSMTKEFNANFTDHEEVPDWDANPIPGSLLSEWLKSVVTTLREQASRIDEIERGLVRHSDVNREEFDQVAWLLDDYCELAEAPWKEVKRAAPLLAGAELAEITAAPTVAQAAVMVRSTLVKAARDPSELAKPLDAVQQAIHHLEIWPEACGHPIMPLSAAIDAHREKGGRGWRGRAEELRGGGALSEVEEGVLADQAYRELLLAKYLRDARAS